MRPKSFQKEVTIDAAPDSTAKVFELPPGRWSDPGVLSGSARHRCERQAGRIKFLLALNEKRNHRLGEVQLVRDAPPNPTPTTPALSQLPKVKLNISSRSENRGEPGAKRVSRSRIPAKVWRSFVRLKVNKGKGGEEISAGNLAGQLHLSAPRREAGNHRKRIASPTLEARSPTSRSRGGTWIKQDGV